VLALVVVVIGFALVVVLFLLLRPRKKPETGTGFLSAQTGFYQVSPPSAAAEPAKETPTSSRGEATMMTPSDVEKTDVFPGALPPLATLKFTQSPDGSRVGEVVPVSQFPFKIGRGSTEPNELRLDEDTSVSRRHATITFENGVFYLSDENSSNGTAVEGKRLPPRTPTELRNGSRVMIGKGTVLTFEAAGGGGRRDDPDKTNYVNMNTLR
jgi:hypothetical protein